MRAGRILFRDRAMQVAAGRGSDRLPSAGEAAMQSTADVTELLNGWRAGDGDARNQLMRLLHPQIAQIAAARMRHERNMSLSTGDLINDAMVRLLRIDRIELSDRAHFLALASRLM